MFNRPFIKLLPLLVPLLGIALLFFPGGNNVPSEVQAQSSNDSEVSSASPQAIDVTIVTDAPKEAGEVVSFVAVIPISPLGLTFSWSFGDDQTTTISNSPIVTHTYASPGTYEVVVIVSNSDGTNTGLDSEQVIILPPPTEVPPAPVPVSGLQISSQGPTEAGSPVNFIATWEEGTDVELTWAFGDGAVQHNAPAIVSHTYVNPGWYIVKVSATNASMSGPATAELPVEITPACITGLEIKVASNAVAGEPVSFEALTTKGTGIRYTWNFGDPSSGADNTLETSNDTVSHTYANPNTYSVSVQAQNACNSQRTTEEVTVGETPLRGLRIVSNSPRDGDEDELTFVALLDRGNVIKYVWDLGDGRVIDTGTTNYISHIYEDNGNYVVKVTVRNGQNQVSASMVASWTNWPPGTGDHIRTFPGDADPENPPVAGVSPSALKAQIPYKFAALPLDEANEPDAPEFFWEFGDGGTATDKIVTHTYKSKGRYGVTATNVDSSEQVYSAVVDVVGGAFFMPLTFDNGEPRGAQSDPPATARPQTPTSPAPTEEPTVPSPSVEPTTPVPTDTHTPVPTDTHTPVPTDTHTPVPTDTPTHTPTPSETPTEVPTQTPTPTRTPGATIP